MKFRIRDKSDFYYGRAVDARAIGVFYHNNYRQEIQ